MPGDRGPDTPPSKHSLDGGSFSLSQRLFFFRGLACLGTKGMAEKCNAISTVVIKIVSNRAECRMTQIIN